MEAHRVIRRDGILAAVRSRLQICAKLNALLIAVVLALLAVGCSGFKRFLHHQEQRKQIGVLSDLRGTVRTEEPSSSPLVVVLIRIEGESYEVVDSFTLKEAGRWRFVIRGTGTYGLGAFEDLNADGNYDAEPALGGEAAHKFEIAGGNREEGIELVIPADGRFNVEGRVDIAALQARSSRDQERATLGQLTVLGDVVDLDDPRFSHENGEKGLWYPLDFSFDVGPGIYFLEDYDPDKVPVLFVHGMIGYPREFEVLAAGLDRQRFQPWFYFYPSGAVLANVSAHLSKAVTDLESRLRFERIFVVAHSMGGLVSRSFILEHHQPGVSDSVQFFASISTPWRGMESARRGLKFASKVMDRLPSSFENVALDSPFVHGLFFQEQGASVARRRLPEEIATHLIFGFVAEEGTKPPSNDGVVSLPSALRLEAWEEAKSQHLVAADHTGILRQQATVDILNQILNDALH
jgi:pimeloyl-ACP methyl ester carboxylesterase